MARNRTGGTLLFLLLLAAVSLSIVQYTAIFQHPQIKEEESLVHSVLEDFVAANSNSQELKRAPDYRKKNARIIQQQHANTTNNTTELVIEEAASIRPPYYMVFSTACSPQQNWQAAVFFYHAHKVKQPGTVVRTFHDFS
jgi:hypothetical protein